MKEKVEAVLEKIRPNLIGTVAMWNWLSVNDGTVKVKLTVPAPAAPCPP